MRNRVERDAAKRVGGVITLLEGYPRMRDLVHNNRENKYDEYWENGKKLHREKVPEVVSGG